MKKPNVTTLLAAIILSSAASPVTFSQTPDNDAPKHSVFSAPALELPAENFELVGVDRRKITVTVLSKSATGVTIRNAEGKEFEIAWDKLSPLTTTKIKGWNREAAPAAPTGDGPPQMPDYRGAKDRAEGQKITSAHKKALFKYWEGKTPTTPTEKRIKELYQEAAPYAIKRNEVLDTLSVKELQASDTLYQEFNKTPASELLKRLKEPSDPIHIKVPIIAELSFFKIAHITGTTGRVTDKPDPEWEKYNIMPWDVLSKLEIKTGPEKVSLRPKFKELGVHVTKETEPIRDLYAVNHLLQFACKSANITPPSIEKIKVACGEPTHSGAYFTQKIDYAKLLEKRPVITKIQIGHPNIPHPLACEIVKHELRNGRPVMSGNGIFSCLLTGFETNEAGKTIWECFDSNPIRVEEGFYTTDSIAPEFSLYFE
jgi:hypothetical protein